MEIMEKLAGEFKIKPQYAENIVRLIEEGNTIPFIARYRKEQTGSMDDQLLHEFADRLVYLKNLEKRREEVRAAIEEAGGLTDELSASLSAAATLAEIEDIYRPFRPKRRTRASVARERGLEPLALAVLEQRPDSPDPLALAAGYVDVEKGVETAEDALAGACDIIAETASDSADVRKALREYFTAEGLLTVKAAREEDSVYRMYYDFSEAVRRLPGHRVLAIDRGEKEGYLRVSLTADGDRALAMVCGNFVRDGSPCTETVRAACADAYARLLFPSIEREVRSALTESAAESAIKVFAVNLRNLLMQPPVKGHVVLGFDPGNRTGCKAAVVDGTGRVLDTAVVYPTPPHNKKEEAADILLNLIEKHGVTVIAIGNGTASRESEAFIAGLIREQGLDVKYMVVSEAGASVYSASRLAAEEFPELDVSLRSAVSIARRLQDPLAELVKIDPKAIGVGQYQHDMPQNRLSQALANVVEDCVNSVGVDVNTASQPLLSRVAGIGPVLAKNIVAYREQNGAFSSRSELLKVPKLGTKSFQQCAGFLRVPESANVLDNSFVHPESYDAAIRLLALCGYSPDDLHSGGITGLRERVSVLGESRAAEAAGVGIPTLRDIVDELLKPGRDPRDELPAPILRSDVMDIDDLKPGMSLKGTVRNVTDFGAFVDIGVHHDGLVHISELSARYVRHPSEVVKIGDIVDVRVLDVDVKKKRISLSMKP